MAKKTASFSWADFWGMFMVTLLLLGGVPVGLVLLLNVLHLPKLGLVAAGGAACLLMLVSLGIRVTPLADLHEKKATGDLDEELGATAAAFLSLALLFALMCKEIHMSFPDQFAGAGTAELSLGTWLLFTMENLAECVLFDIPSIYDWHLTQIAPVAGISRLVTLVFRVSIDVVLITSIIDIVRFLRTGKSGDGTMAGNPVPAQPGGSDYLAAVDSRHEGGTA